MENQQGVLAILQARTSSSRLPNKIMEKILGEPMLLRQIERVRRCKNIDKLIVATSVDPSDDPVEELGQNHSFEVFRGSLDDVLDRYYQASQLSSHQTIVRITGDCPLADPELIDQVISFYHSNDFDYVSNVAPPTYPDGLDTEVFSRKLLNVLWEKANSKKEREHVTYYLSQHPDEFARGNFSNSEDLSSLRWTVDEPRDFQFVTEVYNKLYPSKPDFTWRDVLQLVETDPMLTNINAGIERNEGLRKDTE